MEIGQYALLRDDLNALWAKYWIVYAEHPDRHTLRIRAQSPLALLDRDILPATLYESAPIADVLEEIFAVTGAGVGQYIYALDPGFAGETVTGFCPQQSARERLLWVCFTLGAYVKTFFTDTVQLLPLSDDGPLIPLSETFWKPTVTYSDHVTAVRATAYSFTPGAPATTDEWVKDSAGNTYIVTRQTATLVNPDVPARAPENIVAVDGVTLVNGGNLSGVLSRLARRCFKRTRIDLDVVDNAAYIPGDRVTVYADDTTLYTGHIEACDFAFGAQARATLRLSAVDPADSAALTVNYLWDTTQLALDTHTFPVGYAYRLQARYLDQNLAPHRIVFRPTLPEIAGTLPAEGAAATVPCTPALDLFQSTLEILSADHLTQSESTVILT